MQALYKISSISFCLWCKSKKLNMLKKEKEKRKKQVPEYIFKYCLKMLFVVYNLFCCNF